jgi:hypothetical protein
MGHCGKGAFGFQLGRMTEKGHYVDFYEAAPRVKRSLRVRCPSLPPSKVSGPRRLIQGSHEVGSSFYSRSSGASGARRRMRGVEG